MNRKELEAKKVKELRDVAKEYDIVGRWEMTKTELIDAIIAKDSAKEKSIKKVIENVSAAKATDSNASRKMQHIMNCANGTQIAVKSHSSIYYAIGKLVNRPTERTVTLKIIRVSNKSFSSWLGEERTFNISDIIWVKDNYHKFPNKIEVLFEGGLQNAGERKRYQKKNRTTPYFISAN